MKTNKETYFPKVIKLVEFTLKNDIISRMDTFNISCGAAPSRSNLHTS